MGDEPRPAYRSHEHVDAAAPEGDGLNLAWTRDERDFLAVDLAAVLGDELRAEAEDLAYLDRYLVRDPYGEATLGPALAAAFGLPAWRGHITCGAGVVSLLAGFASLAGRDAVRIVTDAYPDLPYQVIQGGGRCTVSPDARMWFLERPTLMGDAFANLEDLDALCNDAARHEALVVVDESNANYYPPAWSAVRLALARENLVVARGFSKAYGLGGLRLAYCVASAAATARVRSTLAPLLSSSLSLRLGRRVLALGDITSTLRARIRVHAAETRALLAAAGVEASPASEFLPYVLSRASRTQLRELESRGVAGKPHPYWSAPDAAMATIYRLSVPLREARMSRLRDRLAS